MNLIPTTHLTLVRARKQMEAAFERLDWSAVREADFLVSAMLNQAFDDPARNHRLLAGELEKVLALYGVMVKSMPETTVKAWRQPEAVI